MKSDRQRIDELEAQVAGLMRANDGPSRTASPLNVRNGWWLAVLTSTLNPGATATAEVVMWTDGDWALSGTEITVHDYFMNTGQSAAVDTKVLIAWYRNVWVALNWNCEASDTLPE